jgi:hypothetical protein
MVGINAFKILSYGVIGLGFLLAWLAYALLTKEQARETARHNILRAIYVFMGFSLLLCGAGIFGQWVHNGPSTHPSSTQQVGSIQQTASGGQNANVGGVQGSVSVNQDQAPSSKSPEPTPLTRNDIALLLDGGITVERMAALIKERGVDFELTPDLVQMFQQKGANDLVVQELKKNHKR